MLYTWKITGNEIKWENGDKFIANRDIECFDNVDDIFENISGNFIWTDGDSYEGSFKIHRFQAVVSLDGVMEVIMRVFGKMELEMYLEFMQKKKESILENGKMAKGMEMDV